MKCPYLIANNQIVTYTYNYDENNNNTSSNQSLIETRTMNACLENDCAAFQDGKCNYRGD
jgi:hypothetical protein